MGCLDRRTVLSWRRLALRLGPITTLDKEQEPGRPGCQTGSRGGLGQSEMAITEGKNSIMIFGPNPDGTYVAEFRTAQGETLAISVPATETRVLKHFQARMPYGLFVAGRGGHIGQDT
jgi:hypothetical protein